MSTTEKLQNVLTAKNAIRDKFNLGDIPFAKYAENIKAGGGGAEYFKCASVSGAGSATDITVSGAGTTDVNGTYTLVDASATGYDRVWELKGTDYQIKKYNSQPWCIYVIRPDDEGIMYYSEIISGEPWDDSVWYDTVGSSPAPTVTQAPATDTGADEKTWSGYKAILKTETTTTEGETVVVVSGSGIADGNYKLMDSAVTGSSRIWKHTDSEWYFVWTGSMWVINALPTYERGQEAFYPNTTGDENPWDVTIWWGDEGIVNMTVTQQTTEGASETKKYYVFEDTLTEGLTYGNGFTPVVGKVYDAEAMILATLSEKNKYPEIASPMDMTSYTKDDWVVSESDYRFDSTKGYKAFYSNGIWAGYAWLQWQNTAQQVLIRQLTFGYGENSDWIYSCRLDGSDDGEHWTEIGTRDCEYDDKNDTILTYPENETAYYYHRLVVLSSQGSAVVQNLLAKRDIDGKNTP